MLFAEQEQLIRESTRMVVLVKIPTLCYKHKIWEHRRSHDEETSYLIENDENGNFRVINQCPRDQDWQYEVSIAYELFKALGIRGMQILERCWI